ncbi:MAG: PSD1 and planctomycete cytochrome C domain-containing protein [Bryobacteraceae bacterium]
MLPILYLVVFIPLATAAVSFNKDVRPIMADTCFRCHGHDKSSRMANLRLDVRDEALKKSPSGATPIVPGKPDESSIVARIFASDAKLMPPKYSHKELSDAQKQTIRQWVAEGARYEGHWSYEPVRRPAAPGGATHPVDAFIQARLVREGLQPSAEADRRTLIRRVTLDLTGLPPTPAEVAAFVGDSSPDAYEKVVTRLLASPRYAEKQAMHWLDAVRYADTTGFHGDNHLPAWPYRDWVLRAFRDNKPFDEFTREQLAGDLLPNATVDQKVASAYNRINRSSAEGGLQPKEYLAKYAADRVRTVANVWLGATLGCAECHDHKFDPFTSRDFYSMKAFFADIKETGLVPVRGDGAWGSKIQVADDATRVRLAQVDRELAAAKAALENESEKIAGRTFGWEKRVLSDYNAGKLAWRYQVPVSATAANGAKLTIHDAEPVESNFYIVSPLGGASLATEHKPGRGLVIASGPNPDNETYSITLRPGAGAWTALGIEAVQDESLPGSRFGRGSDRFVVTEVDVESSDAPGKAVPLVLATSDGSGAAQENPAMAAIDGNTKTGWGATHHEARSPFLAIRFGAKLQTGAATTLRVRVHHDSDLRKATIGRLRLALSAGAYSAPESGDIALRQKAAKQGESVLFAAGERGLPAAVKKALETEPGKRTSDDITALGRHFQFTVPELEPFVIRVAKLEAERGMLDAAIPLIVVTETVPPPVTRVLPRGNWMDDASEIVQPAVPAFLGKIPAQGRATRLDLANWIASPANPLTARVFVNRVWRQFFGTGLSKVLEDLGSQGEWPAHPELLDWLAAEFMKPEFDAGSTYEWDVKHLVRTIVTSRTYRQTSMSTPALDERDPDNRLLARQSRFRVDAESVHDIALAVSGLLVEKFGGPSAKPYQPEGYLAAMNFPKREYSAGRGTELYRRGLYTYWQRTFLHPTLATFDAPSREECAINRSNSNTPLQALVLLNDPIFVEASRAFAQRIVASGGSAFAPRLDWAFQQALGRSPNAEESRILEGLHRTSLTQFQASPVNARQLLGVGESPVPAGMKPDELAAMTVVARAILNLHETITRN